MAGHFIIGAIVGGIIGVIWTASKINEIVDENIRLWVENDVSKRGNKENERD